MNSAVELHDSEVADIRKADRSLVVELPRAYVHRSSGEPGIDSGSVFLQRAEISISDAVHSVKGQCTGRISVGIVSVNGAQFSLLPVPLRTDGNIVVAITFASGGILSVLGAAISCQVSGEAAFLEKYDG